ncbi:MAG: carboxypeptidase regulatory-like domain-containing protein [Candidatus Thermoplasmatota archaeon]|nr:carboxypeptidase regulatory-like domain-containing protein [Candidatus Thermoplasmatota archaeon]
MARLIKSTGLFAVLTVLLFALSIMHWMTDDGDSASEGLSANIFQTPGTGNVNVTVEDEIGRPLQGVKLTLVGFGSPTYTDGNGSAAFYDVPANSTGVTYALHGNLTRYVDSAIPVTVVENETTEVPMILGGGQISGVVTDSAGRVMNANVSVASPFTSTNVSTMDGSYALLGLPGGDHSVTARASGFVPLTKSVYLPVGGVRTLNFVLTSLNGSISGHVYHSALSTPLFNASVSVQVGSVTLTVATDIVGSYNITNVPEGLYTVTASKEGYNSDSKTAVEVTRGNRTEGVDFYLPEKPTRLYGVVRSGTLLLVGVNVSVVGTSLYNISGPDGSYEIRNITAGEYTLAASAVGYQTLTVTNVVISSGDEVQQNINMVGLPGGILRGKILLADSQQPLTNVQVTIVNLRPQPISRATNINGEFEFAGLAEGNYTIHLEKSGYRPVEIGKILVTEETPAELTLEMTPLREGFEGFVFGFDMAHSMMILALFLTIVILAVAVYLRVRSFQTPETAPAIIDEFEEEAGPSEGELEDLETDETDTESNR